MVLLGAGASAEAGPLTSMAMASEFMSWAFEGRPLAALEKDAAQLDSSQATPGDVLYAIWRYLTDGLGRAPNVEEVALACWATHPDSEVLSRVSPVSRLTREFQGVNPSHIEIIELDLVSRLKEKWLLVDRAKVDYLSSLIKLRSLFPSERLKIFTLNYDLSVEVVCERLGIPWTDGFRNGALSLNCVPVFADAGTDLHAEAPMQALVWKAERPESDPQVEIFKLHGSASWFEQFSDITWTNDLYEIYRSVRAAAGGTLYSARNPCGPLVKLEAASDQVLWQSDAWLKKNHVYFPRIIFGTAFKFLPAVPFVRMYELLYRYLRRSRVCVVVGYSFQDSHVNALLKDAFNRHLPLGQQGLNVVIVDCLERKDIKHEIGLDDETRVFQVVGPASEALAAERFMQLINDLSLRGSSKLPHVIRLCEIGD